MKFSELLQNYKDQIAGGLADNKNPDDYDRKELILGYLVEKEHTTDRMKRIEIAMDHLEESPTYYTDGIVAGTFDEPGVKETYEKFYGKLNEMAEEEGGYEEWSLDNHEEATRNWALHANLYEKPIEDLKPLVKVKSFDELRKHTEEALRMLPQAFKSAYKMFVRFHSDALKGKYQVSEYKLIKEEAIVRYQVRQVIKEEIQQEKFAQDVKKAYKDTRASIKNIKQLVNMKHVKQEH